MSAGQIKPPQPVQAPAQVMAMARENCAAALRARGSEDEAVKFEIGERDFSWRFKHEVSRLQREGLVS